MLSVQINKACGLDIHKHFLIATILGKSGEIAQKRFERNDQGILQLKSLVIEKQCDVVACESTSNFWVPIYDTLISHVTVIVGNACDMKAYSHKKTDKIDSEFIAQLALNDMVKPSRVFPKFHREFRSYVRLRHNLVRKRTDIKNQAHAILSSEMFHLNDILTDIFGKNGRMVLSGICSGKKFDQIVDKLSPNVRKKSEQIKEILEREMSQSAALRLRTCLSLIQHETFNLRIYCLEK